LICPYRSESISHRRTPTTALAECFWPDAIVRDEGKTIEGLDAISAWLTETGKKYAHSVEPLTIAERDGKVIVTAKVSGAFPGSPINLDHIFEIDRQAAVSQSGRLVSVGF
jgi:hypothetical protein